MPFGHPYGAFGKTSSNGFGGEVRAAITFLCFELSETSDVLAGLVAAVLGRYLDLADHCCGQALIVDQLLELGGVSLSSLQSAMRIVKYSFLAAQVIESTWTKHAPCVPGSHLESCEDPFVPLAGSTPTAGLINQPAARVAASDLAAPQLAPAQPGRRWRLIPSA